MIKTFNIVKRKVSLKKDGLPKFLYTPIKIDPEILNLCQDMDKAYILSNTEMILFGKIMDSVIFNYFDFWTDKKTERLYDFFIETLSETGIVFLHEDELKFAMKLEPKKSISNFNFKLKNKETFIYMMKDDVNGFIKIGMSAKPQYREKTLQSEKPSIILIFKHKGYQEDEKKLHQMFDSKRIRGEWFDLAQDEIQKVKNYFKEKSNTNE